jgi:hypothetical protein
MTKKKLDFKIMHREGIEADDYVVHERYSVDFTIDGDSLLKMIVDIDKGNSDYLGCFARNWDNLNEHSKKQLLLVDAPETESGRRLIYVCPECADIGCGAYGCKISKLKDSYIWSDFAYENGYEDPVVIDSIGPFEFEILNYESVIKQAMKL